MMTGHEVRKESNGLYHAINLKKICPSKQTPVSIVKRDFLKKNHQEIYIHTPNKMSFNSFVIIKQ